jgi:hypothetical protein
LSNRRDSGRIVSRPENGRAGDDGGGAGGDYPSGCRHVFSAIDFDDRMQIARGAHLSYPTNLGQHFREEGLAAEPRINGHYQNHIAEMQDVFYGVWWRRGIEHHAGAFSKLAGLGQGAVEVNCRAGLGLDKQVICPRLGKVAE